MKIDTLTDYIKKLVKQEVGHILKTELKSQLSEIFTNSQTKPIPSKIKDDVLLESEIVPHIQPPKKFVKYTNNDILNQVLNETKGGVPREGEMVGLMGGGFNSESSSQLNEVKIPENASDEVKTVYKAITKDYRNLLKTINDKKRDIV